MRGVDNTHYFVDGKTVENAKPCLIVMAGGELGHVFLLETCGDYLIGRLDGAAIKLSHTTVSRNHAIIRHTEDGFFVKDLDTVNGTFVNDEQTVEWTELHDGAVLRLGGAVLKFLFSESAESAFYTEMYRLATRDALTELGNRRYFLDAIQASLGQLQRNGRSASLMLFDIDYFKQINDRFGHGFGDTVLKSFAATLKRGLREHDIEGRIGGEEFAIFLPETTANVALRIAERIRAKHLEHTETEFGTERSSSVSVGVTCFTMQKNHTVEHAIKIMLDRADKALYASKNAGRNRVSFFSD